MSAGPWGGLSPHSLGLLSFCAQTVTCHRQRPGPIPGHTWCPGVAAPTSGLMPPSPFCDLPTPHTRPLSLRVSLLLRTPQAVGVASKCHSVRAAGPRCTGGISAPPKLPACRSLASVSSLTLSPPRRRWLPVPGDGSETSSAGPPRAPRPAWPLRDTPSPARVSPAPSQSPGAWPL